MNIPLLPLLSAGIALGLSAGCLDFTEETASDASADAAVDAPAQDAATETGAPDAVIDAVIDAAADAAADGVVDATPDAQPPSDTVDAVDASTGDDGSDGGSDGDGDGDASAACATPDDCDDGNTCTANACELDGTCSTTVLIGGGCEDGSPCTLNDSCNTAGECIGDIVNCDDGDPCTSDACDALTGACTATPAPDGQVCDPGYNCAGNGAVCTAGQCGCSCASDNTIRIALPGQPAVPLVGSVVLNPNATSTDVDNTPLATAGPLSCADDWNAGGTTTPALLTQATTAAFPIDIAWTRPCAGVDALADLASQFAAAGNSWTAEATGVFVDATLELNDPTGTVLASTALNDFHVVAIDPPPGECEDVETLRMQANPSAKGLRIETVLGTWYLGEIQMTVGGTALPAIDDPFGWDETLFPGGAPGTLQLTSPCGDAITNDYFGWPLINLWTSDVSGSIWLQGHAGAIVGGFNIYGAVIEDPGTCLGGSRTATVSTTQIEMLP